MSSQPPNQTRTAPSRGGSDTAPASEKAKEVASEASGQAKQLAGEAKEQAREVVSDIKDHARDVMGQTRTEVRQQAEQGTQRVAGGLRTLGEQIQALREGRTDDAGAVAGYADQARRKVDELANRLDRHGIDGVASDLTAFARRRPGLFLLSCAGAGFALARVVRSQAAASSDGEPTTATFATTASTRPAVGVGSFESGQRGGDGFPPPVST
jgi:hypothetical protein